MRSVVCGLIGPTCTSQARTRWNALFTEKGTDAFFDFYRTVTTEDLELRLSEMFLLQRRGYVVDPLFETVIIRLLDQLDPSAIDRGSVDTVVNERGVLVGHFCDNDGARLKLWFGNEFPNSKN